MKIARSLLFVAFVALAVCQVVEAKESKKKSEKKDAAPTAEAASVDGPLLTIAGTWSFVSTSVSLTYNTACFTAHNVGAAVWDAIPEDARKPVSEQYNTITGQAEQLRIQNGIPTMSALQADVKREWSSKVQPVIDAAISQTKAAMGPVEKMVAATVQKFEEQYPSMKGVMPKDLFDIVFVLLFLIFVVVKIMMSIFCGIVCCGYCASRKSNTASVVSSNVSSPAGKKNKKKNN